MFHVPRYEIHLLDHGWGVGDWGVLPIKADPDYNQKKIYIHIICVKAYT